MKVTELTEMTGDAFSSTRKGKKNVFFEFKCKGKWEGELINEEGRVTGTGDGDLEIPSLDHDSDISKLEVLVTACDDGGDADRRLAAFFKRYGIPSLRKLLQRFIAELREQ